MKFTKEAWENAPEGAKLEWYRDSKDVWEEVILIGFLVKGNAVIECPYGALTIICEEHLRIILPKRKVTVRLLKSAAGNIFAEVAGTWPQPGATLLGEHTFEIEGE